MYKLLSLVLVLCLLSEAKGQSWSNEVNFDRQDVKKIMTEMNHWKVDSVWTTMSHWPVEDFTWEGFQFKKRKSRSIPDGTDKALKGKLVVIDQSGLTIKSKWEYVGGMEYEGGSEFYIYPGRKLDKDSPYALSYLSVHEYSLDNEPYIIFGVDVCMDGCIHLIRVIPQE